VFFFQILNGKTQSAAFACAEIKNRSALCRTRWLWAKAKKAVARAHNMADMCHFEGDNFFNEMYSWPIAMAAVYFKVQYITDRFWSTVAFVYVFQALALALSLAYKMFKNDRGSATAQWIADNVFGWFAPPSGIHEHFCYESIVVALIGAPLLAFCGALLWEVGVKRCVGISYPTVQPNIQHVVVWVTFVSSLGLLGRGIFATNRGDLLTHSDAAVGEAQVDYGMLALSLLCVMMTVFVPWSIARRFGVYSAEYGQALRAWIIFSCFYLFIIFFANFSKPLIGHVRSAYTRTLLALGILFAACFMAGAWQRGAAFAARRAKRRREGR
jgi:hypothetical protein